jgi:Na+-translocating ferredoxin:NAD+ oxidoreductase RnfG subunit
MKWFKSLRLWKKILVIWLSLSAILAVIGSSITPEEQLELKKQATEEKIAEEKAESLMLESNKPITAYIYSKKAIRNNLKDPDSYDEISEIHHRINKTKDGAEIEVVIEYTSTNSFGGRVRNTAIFLYTNDLRLVKFREL